jgi:hypothetical protein
MGSDPQDLTPTPVTCVLSPHAMGGGAVGKSRDSGWTERDASEPTWTNAIEPIDQLIFFR